MKNTKLEIEQNERRGNKDRKKQFKYIQLRC